MNNEIRAIEPSSLWNNFTDLNSVPRPSKREEKVIDFLIQFAEKLNLNCFQDSIGNLIINKPSTEDMKDCKTIVLQSHVDMVHEKNNNVDLGFTYYFQPSVQQFVGAFAVGITFPLNNKK